MFPSPQEIIGVILGHLQTDRYTLSACSLVSRSWRVESQRYLFRVFKINVSNSFDRLHNFSRFLQLCICFDGYILELRIWRGRFANFRDNLPLSALSIIIQRLSALQTLQIVGMSWFIDQPISPPIIAPSLRVLVVTNEPSNKPATLHHLFAWFPMLQEFNLFGAEGYPNRTYSLRSAPTLAHTLALKSLRIQAIMSPQKRLLLKAIQKTSSAASLHVLELEVISRDDIQLIGRLLHSVGRNLQKFTLRIVHRWNLPTGRSLFRMYVFDFPNLQSCTRLRRGHLVPPEPHELYCAEGTRTSDLDHI